MSARKLEEGIEARLRDLEIEEGYEATCAEDVPWEDDETFSCLLEDRHGDTRLVPARVESGLFLDDPELGIVVDMNSLPQTPAPSGPGRTWGEMTFRKSQL